MGHGMYHLAGSIPSEALLWVAGTMVPAGLAWAVAVLWLLRDIKRSSDRLIDMHENADAAGFGTRAIAARFASLEDTMRELVHYTKWSAEQTVGTTAPPPPPRIRQGESGD